MNTRNILVEYNLATERTETTDCDFQGLHYAKNNTVTIEPTSEEFFKISALTKEFLDVCSNNETVYFATPSEPITLTFDINSDSEVSGCISCNNTSINFELKDISVNECETDYVDWFCDKFSFKIGSAHRPMTARSFPDMVNTIIFFAR